MTAQETAERGKHTPGPWELVLENRTAPTIESKGRYIAQTITYGNPETIENWDIANARLIAECPTMYDYIYVQARRGDMQAQKMIDKIGAAEQG